MMYVIVKRYIRSEYHIDVHMLKSCYIHVNIIVKMHINDEYHMMYMDTEELLYTREYTHT